MQQVRRPQRGDKTKVIDLAHQNAELSLREHLNYNETAKRVHDALLEDLQKQLKLEVLPRRIECFDISTVQGAFSVGSMVVFKDGKADKKSYRHFTIKHTLEVTRGKEPNDFEMMREVLRRRLQRAGEALGDLVLVDRHPLGVAVHGRGGREHQPADAGVDATRRRDGAAQVLVEELEDVDQRRSSTAPRYASAATASSSR